jgi:hypothetical protein
MKRAQVVRISNSQVQHLVYITSLGVLFCFVFAVLGIELRALVGKHSTTELHPHP